MKKPISIVTDNDGDISTHITKKYEGYIGNEFLNFFYETDEGLKTIEPSVVAVNLEDSVPTESFLKSISKNGSMLKKSADEAQSFMTNNKVEWALRVFDSEEKIKYPGYVNDVIKQYH